MDVQWAHLGADRLLVASPTRARVVASEPTALHPRRPMAEGHPATPQAMGQLLDGAIALAEREAPATDPPPLTAVRWAWQLVGQWYCAHHSVALLPALIARYEELDRAELCAYAQRKLTEEAGHDALAQADLSELGYDAPAVLTFVPPPPAVVEVVAYARSLVQERPVEWRPRARVRPRARRRGEIADQRTAVSYSSSRRSRRLRARTSPLRS